MAIQRLFYLDTLKGVLIILVVLGHCGTALSTGLLSSIYAFHMPLFILVSGYLSKKSATSLLGGGNRLIVIYLVFNTLYIVLDAVTVGASWHRILVPSFALWYILSLIYWRVSLQLIPQKWINKPKTILSISFLLSLLVGFIPLGNEMSFQRAIVFWPFFILGYYLRQKEGMRWLRKQNKWISGSILLIMLLIAYLFLPPFYANAPYREDMMFEELLLRSVQQAIALTICCSAIALIPEKLGKITDIGKYTLIIYLLHPPIVKTLKVVSAHIGYQPDLLIAILITSFTVILIYSLRKIKIFKYIV